MVRKDTNIGEAVENDSKCGDPIKWDGEESMSNEQMRV